MKSDFKLHNLTSIKFPLIDFEHRNIDFKSFNLILTL